MIDSCPALSKLVTRRRSRQAGNNDEIKTFPGGAVFFVGSNSPSAVRSTPCRYVMLDEVDGYSPGTGAGGEGDICALAIARTLTFGGRRKVFAISTPTLLGTSRIDKMFGEGDQRRYHVPCPVCGTLQVLRFSQLRWPGDDRTKTFYVCEHCGESVNERHKSGIVAKGVWIPSAQGDGKTVSYHLNSLISPFVSWSEIALEHLACGDDPARLQVWTNTLLGECWQDTAAIPLDATRIMARASSWGDVVPDAVAVLTAGIDVQINRLEFEIVGWGAGEQSWSLEYHSLPGNPSEPKVWARLDELLARKRPHRKLGTISVSCACVDSGNWSEFVCKFTGPNFSSKNIRGERLLRPERRHLAAPTSSSEGRPTIGAYIAGSTAAKEVSVARLRIDRPGNGFCHFPSDRDLDYYEMLTAEKPIRRFVGGVAKRVWVISRPASATRL